MDAASAAQAPSGYRSCHSSRVGSRHLAWPATTTAPWEFQGEIIGRITRLPIAGVEVDVSTEQGTIYLATHTDAQGRYDLLLPRPQPKIVRVVLRKNGYEGDQVMVPTSKSFNSDMAKLP
jgi:hypothetical protein